VVVRPGIRDLRRAAWRLAYRVMPLIPHDDGSDRHVTPLNGTEPANQPQLAHHHYSPNYDNTSREFRGDARVTVVQW